VFDKLECLLRKIRKKGDCIVLMGDFNGRLARGKPRSKGRVGQFTPHGKADQLGLCLTALMEEFDLFAPQTFFPSTKQACRQLGNATYVIEKRSAAELRRLGIKPQPAAMIAQNGLKWAKRAQQRSPTGAPEERLGALRPGLRRQRGANWVLVTR
jgi:hypothetical protein